MEITNEIVAEKVLGWEKLPTKTWWYLNNKYISGLTPDFLNDWNAARLVIEKIVNGGIWAPRIDMNYLEEWVVCFYHHDGSGDILETENCLNKSFPAAVCEAALKALEVI